MLLAEAMKKEKVSIIDLESIDATTVVRITSISKIKTSNKSTVGIQEMDFIIIGCCTVFMFALLFQPQGVYSDMKMTQVVRPRRFC